ncbi:MAG: tetratricopeptide repeat protein [bacterium]|nr:tetratricopeptide repeat protein [bacterium]
MSKKKTTEATACLLLLFSLAACGGPQDPIAHYQYAANQSAALQFNIAQTYEREGKFETAIIEYRHFLDYYPDVYYAEEARMGTGRCLEKLNQWQEAIAAYQLLIKNYKKSDLVPEAIYRMASTYIKAERWEGGVKAYQGLLKDKKYFNTEWGKLAKEEVIKVLDRFPESKWAQKAKKKVEKQIEKMEKK